MKKVPSFVESRMILVLVLVLQIEVEGNGLSKRDRCTGLLVVWLPVDRIDRVALTLVDPDSLYCSSDIDPEARTSRTFSKRRAFVAIEAMFDSETTGLIETVLNQGMAHTHPSTAFEADSSVLVEA
jgi:hypothetical protein